MKTTDVLVWIGGLVLWTACGGSDAAEGEAGSASATRERPAAARAEAPNYDPEARYDGRTLGEYATGLEDLNPSVRKRALQSVLEFGVNAYPLKDRMRTMAVEDTDDELRAAAVVALFRMQDPGAIEFLLERVSDPDAMPSDQGWRMLLQVAVEEVEPDRLASTAADVVRRDVAHGEHLLAVTASGVPRSGDLRVALAEALMEVEHSDAAARTILGLLHLVQPEDARLDYVRDHHAAAGADPALAALRAIGGAEAFDLALEVVAAARPPLRTRLATIVNFPPEGVTHERRLDALAAELPTPAQADVQQVFAALDQVARGGGAERWGALLTGFAGAEHTEDVRSLALLYLCQGAGEGRLDAGALDPVFTALREDPAELVLGTALAELKTLAARAPAGVAARLPADVCATMYHRAAADPWSYAVAQGMLDVLRAGQARLDAAAVTDALVAQFEAHPDHPVNFQVLQWVVPMGNQLGRLGAPMPRLASLVARLLLDGSMGEAEREWAYSGANFSTYNNTSRADVETIVAFYEPIMLAPELPEGRYYASMRQNATGVLYNLRGQPGLEPYLAFVQRMASDAPPKSRVEALWGMNFWLHNSTKPAERKGMSGFPHELAGRAATVKPTVLGRHRKIDTIPFAVFFTGAEEEVFLATRLPDSDPPYLGELTGLPSVLSIAFLDEAGRVVELSRTDAAGFARKQGKRVYLTHPDARHALVFVPGAFDLAVGDGTGFDPEFLALL